MDTLSIAIITFFAVFFLFAFAGVPLAFSLGISSIIVALVVGGVSPYLLVKAFYYPFQSFSLVAIYLFVAMGIIFYRTGLASLLVDSLRPLIGRKRYGLPLLAVLTSAIFGLLTGSAVATAATMGTFIGREMEKRGYPKAFTAAVIANAAPLGALIPPSIPALVLAISTNTSVLTNFAVVGAIGIELTILLSIAVIILSQRRKYGIIEERAYTRREVIINALKALSIAIVPISVLGSIYSGLLSVSEAGAAGVVSGLLLAAAYRRLNLRILYDILKDSAISTASVFLLISASYMVSYVWGISKVYVALNNAFASLAVISPLLTLLAVAGFLLVMGMFIDLIIFNITLAPIIVAILRPLDINPYHINAIFALGNLIGTVTPPVGTVLAMACKVLDASIDADIIRETWLLLVPSIVIWILVIFVPQASLWLPQLLGLRLS